MTYIAYETSVQDGDPTYRVLAIQGVTEYRYTTGPVIVTDSAEDWLPSPIDIGEITQTNEMGKNTLKISLPRDNALAQTFTSSALDEITTITIFRGHVSDTSEEFLVAWKGRVAGSSGSVDSINLDCENIFTSMRRHGLRRRYQRACPYSLYGHGCGLAKASFAATQTATAASGRTVTITVDSNTLTDAEFTGGMIETTTGVYRMIEKNVSGVLTLSRPDQALIDLIALSGPQTVTVYPGCDRSMTTCDTRFNNLLNYGGWPWIPDKNPFSGSITGAIV